MAILIRFRALAGFFIVGLLGAWAWADEPAPLSAESRRERLKVIRGIVQTLDATLVNGDRMDPATLLAEPSLLYADNVRELSDASMWVWEHQGRAVGVTAVEWHPNAEVEVRWTFEFASLTPTALRLNLLQGNWSTASGVATPRAVPNAPAIAETRARRQLQMKQIAERFTAIEMHRQENRIELRRLAAPVYRQAEAAPGDGALFVFAHGTNPEAVLAVSTLETKDGPVYSLGALCAEECAVSLDEREIWRETRFTGPGARRNYTNGRLQAPSATK